MVLPLDIALGQEANATRALPATVQQGETFEVIITFTAPADEFSSIGLRDTAPDGWNATVDAAWCTPNADAGNDDGARASLTWIGPYSEGTNFTVMHKVTVPCNASLGSHSFDVSPYESFLYYYVATEGPYSENITGDYEVEVIPPAILTSPASISFYAAFGGQNPQNQTLQLWSSTPCMLNWTANITGTNVTWLSVSPTNGSCTDEHSSVAVSVNTSDMSVGNYTANITIEAPEARNSPQIIPVGLYIRETGTLQGTVNFEGRGDAPNDKWIEPFVVKLFQPGELSQPIWTGVATTNDTGVFTIPEVVAGIYDIGIKNATCLSEVVTNVTVGFNETTVVDFGEIREGDVKTSDKVDGFDVSLLSDAYGSRSGDPNWNPDADLNRSGKVDGFDASLLSPNYGVRGAAYGCF